MLCRQAEPCSCGCRNAVAQMTELQSTVTVFLLCRMHLASGSRTAVTCRVLLWFVAFTSRTLVISSSQQLRSQLYSSSGAASSSGSAMCTVDKPTAVTPAIRSSMLQCAVECTTHSCCLMYQLDAELKQCQLYNYLPLNYSAITGCISSFRELLMTDFLHIIIFSLFISRKPSSHKA